MDINIDPYILLSVVNTRLRNQYDSLDAFLEDEVIDKEVFLKKLHSIGYKYNSETNQFVGEET